MPEPPAIRADIDPRCGWGQAAAGLKTPRRAFIIAGLSTAGIGAGTWSWLRAQGYQVAKPLGPNPGSGEPRLAALPGAPYPPLALATLRPLVDILLPGDPDLALPSGQAAGVIDFLVSASAAPGLTPVRNDVLKLTRFLDRMAQGLRGVRFSVLSDPEDQRALVQEASADHTARGRFIPARALEATLRLCLEGYLGHPHHGANRDFKVWRALGINMPEDRSPQHQHHG